MKISVDNSKPNKKKTSMLCCFVLDNAKSADIGKLEPKIEDAIKRAIHETKKAGEVSIIQTLGKMPSTRIALVGMGPKNKTTSDVLRNVSGIIAKKASSLQLKEFSIVIPENLPFDLTSTVNAIVEGVKLSLYSFDKFKKEKGVILPSLTLLSSKSNVKQLVSQAQIISDGVLFTRDIANLPPNQCAPAELATITKSMSTKTKLKCKIFSKNELKNKKFGGIVAVGQGSKNEPRLIILEHNKGRRGQKPIVLVGKAVTFDTGGISIKPSEKMDEMKFDKCGGCTVIGIMKAIAELKLPINVVGIVPSVENMPGGGSYRPGDIIRLYNGKTAEILNTDAEGRVILADALSYGIKNYSPKAIIDFATLTGACIVALGNNVAGIVSNNQTMTKKILSSSEKTAELVWQLPLDDDYMDMIKSNVADMKNVGMGRAAGTITAAAFLANAIDDTPWVHIDIAGTAWTQDATKKKSYLPKGATGFGVRLVLDYLKNNL